MHEFVSENEAKEANNDFSSFYILTNIRFDSNDTALPKKQEE